MDPDQQQNIHEIIIYRDFYEYSLKQWGVSIFRWRHRSVSL